MLRYLAVTLFTTTVLSLLALTALLVGNTLLVPDYQPRPSDVTAARKFDGNKLASRLAEAVRFRTISWQDGASAEDMQASERELVAFRDWISATYPAFTAAVTREIVGDYSLLFVWKGSNPSLKPILLMSHMDVVPVVPGSLSKWEHPPFSGDVANGYVWGRGSLDLKQGIIGQLEAVEALIRSGFKPARTVMFAIGHDEETDGHKGHQKIAELLASRHITFEMILDEGGAVTHGIIPGIARPVAHVGVAEKGYVTLKLTAHADGGHSSLPPPIAETAIGRLARALERLGNNPFESRVDGTSRKFLESLMPAMDFGPRAAIANLWLLEPVVARLMSLSSTVGVILHTTISPTMIQGGIKENVLPSEAALMINFRIHERDTIAGVVEHVRKAINDEHIDITVMPGSLEPSAVTDVNGPQFALVKATLQKVVPGVIVAPNLISGGTDSIHYRKLTKSVFRHIPVEVQPDDLERFHGTNERVRISSLVQVAAFYHELIVGADGDLNAKKPD